MRIITSLLPSNTGLVIIKRAGVPQPSCSRGLLKCVCVHEHMQVQDGTALPLSGQPTAVATGRDTRCFLSALATCTDLTSDLVRKEQLL